jgi:GDP-D-mannose dehydratase
MVIWLSTNIIRIIQEVQPDEIYNLGAMSHVMVSFDSPEYVANVDGLGTLRILRRFVFRFNKENKSVSGFYFWIVWRIGRE